MTIQPTIITERLKLRQFIAEDAMLVEHLAGNKSVASMTMHIPHPYPQGLAAHWIDTHPLKWESKTLCCYAITKLETNTLMGCASLMNIKNNSAELGYWLGAPYWSVGFCTEACDALVKFGHSTLDISHLYASYLSKNPASGKVLHKLGFAHLKSEKVPWPQTGLDESVEHLELVW